MHGITRRSLLLGTGGLALVGAACGDDEEGTLARARREGFIRVGFANEVPYAYATPAGALTGEAPEVARVVMGRLGVGRLDGVLTRFDRLIPELRRGRFDLIAAGMFITPERCREILFSDPDYVAGQAFAVARGNPRSLRTYRDVARDEDAVLGVLSGGVERMQAADMGVPPDRLVSFPEPQAGVEALRLGRIDALALTSISVRRLVRGASDLSMARPFFTGTRGNERPGAGAYGFRRRDRELRNAFNAELRRLKRSGELIRIARPFGFTRFEIEGTRGLSAAKLCS